jgi:hypothetical protein
MLTVAVNYYDPINNQLGRRFTKFIQFHVAQMQEWPFNGFLKIVITNRAYLEWMTPSLK